MKQASVFAAALLAALSAQPAAAQPRAGTTQQTPRSAAPIDLTGYWVAVVTEDWRHRMATARKGDFESLPLNAEGRRVANEWNLEIWASARTTASCLSRPRVIGISLSSIQRPSRPSSIATRKRAVSTGDSSRSPIAVRGTLCVLSGVGGSPGPSEDTLPEYESRQRRATDLRASHLIWKERERRWKAGTERRSLRCARIKRR